MLHRGIRWLYGTAYATKDASSALSFPTFCHGLGLAPSCLVEVSRMPNIAFAPASVAALDAARYNAEELLPPLPVLIDGMRSSSRRRTAELGEKGCFQVMEGTEALKIVHIHRRCITT